MNWEKELETHIANMRASEDEERRKSGEHRTKFEQIMQDRLDLEQFIYKTKRRLSPDVNDDIRRHILGEA